MSPAHETSGQIDDIEGFACIELVTPGTNEMEDIARRFGLHELAVEDALKAHQRPKIERYGDCLFLVLKSARYNDEQERVDFGEVQLIFGEDFLVVVRHDPALEIDYRSERGTEIGELAPDVVVHRVIDQIVDAYAPVIAGLETDVQEVETTVFAEDIYPTERIYLLKRQLLAFLHNTRPLAEPLEGLIDRGPPEVSDDLMEYFRDVSDHLARVVTRAERSSALMSEMLDANLAQVGLRQNEDMRKISAWAAVFLLPTVLSGIWGMNFENMPETEWVYGYPVALGIMVGGTFLLHWWLRRSGWL